MTTLRQIARDPRKALNNLEKELGAAPGELLSEMEGLGNAGEDWSQHLPYGVAKAYYENAQTRAPFEEHVDSCRYCQELLQTLHPTPHQVADFVRRASRTETRAPAGVGRFTWWMRIAPVALAASAIMFVVGGSAYWYARKLTPTVTVRWSRCVVEGGDPTACALLHRAAHLQTQGDPQLANSVLLAALQQSGVQELALKDVASALDPSKPFVVISAANTGREPAASSKSYALLTAVHSSLTADQPVAGYGHLLAYLRESQTSEAPARAFEIAFFKPVRSASIGQTADMQVSPAQVSVQEIKLTSAGDSREAAPQSQTNTVAAGKSVYFSTEIKGAPAHTPVSVVWFDSTNQEVRRETSWTYAEISRIVFAVADTSRWKSGEYRADLWVGNDKVKQQTFSVIGKEGGEAGTSH